MHRRRFIDTGGFNCDNALAGCCSQCHGGGVLEIKKSFQFTSPLFMLCIFDQYCKSKFKREKISTALFYLTKFKNLVYTRDVSDFFTEELQ